MALPFTIDLTGSGSSLDLGELGDYGQGTWSTSAFPNSRTAAGGSGNTTASLSVTGDGAGGGEGRWVLDLAGSATRDLTAELENSRVIVLVGSTEYIRVDHLGARDSLDPYSWSDADGDASTALLGSGATTVTLRFESRFQPPRDANPGSVSAGAPTVSLQAAVTAQQADADPGNVSAGAARASLSPETHILPPVNADAGTVAAGAASASLSPDSFSGTARNARISTRNSPLEAAAPSVSAGPALDVLNPEINADPGAVTAAAPTVSLQAAGTDPAFDISLGTVSAGPASARLLPELGGGPRDITIRRTVPGARAILDALPVGGPGDDLIIRVQAPAPSVTAGPEADALFGPYCHFDLAPALEVYSDDIPAPAAAGANWQRAFRALAPDRTLLTAVVLEHPAAPEPARIVSGGRDLVLAGREYLAAPFTVRLANDEEDRPPRAQLSIIWTGAEMAAILEATSGALDATCELSEWSAIDGRPHELEWRLTYHVIDSNVARAPRNPDLPLARRPQVLNLILGVTPRADRPGVSARYTPETDPWLFA